MLKTPLFSGVFFGYNIVIMSREGLFGPESMYGNEGNKP
jgi:hypothetical protein